MAESTPPPPLPVPAMPASYPGADAPTQKVPGSAAMLYWWAGIPALIFIVLAVVMKLPEAKRKSASPGAVPGYLTGTVLAGILLPLLLAWIVWLISRKRIASTLAFLGGLLFMTYVVVHSSLLGGKVAEQKALRTIVQSIAQKRDTADRAMKTISEAHAISSLGTKDRAELGQTLSLLDAAIVAVNDVRTSADVSNTQLDAELTAVQVSSADRDALAAKLRDEIAPVQKSNDANLKLLQATRDFAEFLRDHFGDWAFDAQSHRFEFKTDAEVEEFGRVQKAMADAARVRQQLDLSPKK